MSEKRILIVDAELVKKIDENRNDLSRSEFLHFLIDSQLKEESKKQPQMITKDEIYQFQEGTKELLRSFLDFFITYGLELGRRPESEQLQELSQRLQALGSSGKSKSL